MKLPMLGKAIQNEVASLLMLNKAIQEGSLCWPRSSRMRLPMLDETNQDKTARLPMLEKTLQDEE